MMGKIRQHGEKNPLNFSKSLTNFIT